MDGQNFLNSECQFVTMVKGEMITRNHWKQNFNLQNGPLTFLDEISSAKKAIAFHCLAYLIKLTCKVFPSPISSPNIPFNPVL